MDDAYAQPTEETVAGVDKGERKIRNIRNQSLTEMWDRDVENIM